MKKLRDFINRIIALREKSKALRNAVVGMACVVVFCVTYALILPALTLDSDTADQSAGVTVGTVSSETAPEETVAEEQTETEQTETEQTETVQTEPVQTETETETEPVQTASAPATYTYEGDGVQFEAGTDENSGLPSDAALAVTEIRDYGVTEEEAQAASGDEEIQRQREQTELYASYRTQAADALRETKGEGYSLGEIRFYDFSFVSGGQTVKPASPVDVTLTYDEALTVGDRAGLTAIHFVPDGDPVFVPLSALTPDGESNAPVEQLTFQADSFSVWAVAEVVDHTAGTLEAAGEGYSVTVTYGADAMIPQGAVLETSEIAQDTEEYRSYCERAAETLGAENGLASARFFDIRILYNGEEIEPAVPVSVQIAYDEPLQVEPEQSVEAVHFAETESGETPEVLTVSDVTSETADGVETVTDVTFEQESFSVVGTVIQNVSSGWPSDGSVSQVLVVTPDNTNYYAVKYDGSLTEVTYSDGQVTFPSTFTSTSDLSDYYWTLTASTTYPNWRFIESEHNTFIRSYSSSGIVTSQPTYPEYRDSYGHIVYQSFLYSYYLGINDDNTALKGQYASISSITTVSNDACAAMFVSSFSVTDDTSSGSGSGGSGTGGTTTTGTSLVSSIVEDVSTGWPSTTSSVGNVMVVTPDNSTYYAVKTDGTLTPVTIETDSSGTKTVVFSTDDVADTDALASSYYWYLENNSTYRRIGTGSGTYLFPYASSAETSTYASSAWLRRDSSGHIVDHYSSGYYYLGIDTTANTITGGTASSATVSDVSESAVAVSFARNFTLRDDSSGSGSGGGSGSGTGSGTTTVNPLGEPEVGKTLTDNGDGTYELALSVTGKTLSLTENGQADVIIVFDNSSSMVEHDDVTLSNGTTGTRLDAAKEAINTLAITLLGQNTTDNPEAVRLSMVTFGNQAYISEFGTSKLEYTYNKEEFQEVLSGITPASISQVSISEGMGTEGEKDGSGQGTNWEDAFQTVKDVPTRDTAQTYVIVVSDGNPTFRNTAGDYYGADDYYYFTPDYPMRNAGGQMGNYDVFSSDIPDDPANTTSITKEGVVTDSPYANEGNSSAAIHVYGTGSDSLNSPGVQTYISFDGYAQYNGVTYDNTSGYYYIATSATTNIERCFDHAKDDAYHLGPADTSSDALGVTGFYSINAFGSATRMENIVKYVYTGNENGTYDDLANHYFEANDEAALEDAFDSIVAQILMDYMYTGVTITDGLTDLTNTEAKVGDLLTEPEFSYYKYGGAYDETTGTYQYGTADNPTEFDPVTEWGTGHSAQYADGKVTWNLCENTGAWDDVHLEDGVTYVVKFRVWPDQTAYDTLAAIRNADDPDAYYNSSNVSDELRAQIVKGSDGVYRLLTNTDADVSYDVIKRTQVKPETAGESGVTNITSGTVELPAPDGMPLTATEMTVAKVWIGDTTSTRPASVTLRVYQSETSAIAEAMDTENSVLVKEISLPKPDPDTDVWSYTIHIAPALIVTQPVLDDSGNPTYDDEGNAITEDVVLEPGHYYWIDEADALASGYTFVGEWVHPYLKDSSTDVTTDEDPNNRLTAKNELLGLTIRKMNNATSEDDIVYLDGAHFKLTKKNASGTYESIGVVNSSGVTEYPYDDFTITDGETGYSIGSLTAGDYKLEELSAPDGYIILDRDTYFTINESGTEMVTLNTEEDSTTDNVVISGDSLNILTIKNEEGTPLPNTGGEGTAAFAAAGTVLVLGAAAGWFVLRKKHPNGP